MKYIKQVILNILFYLFKDLFYYKDNSPKRCNMCGNKEFESIISDTINGIVCEESIVCKKCVCRGWVLRNCHKLFLQCILSL